MDPTQGLVFVGILVAMYFAYRYYILNRDSVDNLSKKLGDMDKDMQDLLARNNPSDAKRIENIMVEITQTRAKLIDVLNIINANGRVAPLRDSEVIGRSIELLNSNTATVIRAIFNYASLTYKDPEFDKILKIYYDGVNSIFTLSDDAFEGLLRTLENVKMGDDDMAIRSIKQICSAEVSPQILQDSAKQFMEFMDKNVNSSFKKDIDPKTTNPVDSLFMNTNKLYFSNRDQLLALYTRVLTDTIKVLRSNCPKNGTTADYVSLIKNSIRYLRRQYSRYRNALIIAAYDNIRDIYSLKGVPYSTGPAKA